VSNERIRVSWEEHATRGFAAAVSLHGHTRRSRETLTFVPEYASVVPVLRGVVARYVQEYTDRRGQPPDFSRAYWQPPLLPAQALRLEQEQIEGRDLWPLVSLTDHDNIDAGMELSAAGYDVPVSVEWTVPFSNTFFHLGIHNLPKGSAAAAMRTFSDYRQQPSPPLLKEILRELVKDPGVLVVLNHPMWDQSGIGEGQHEVALGSLLHWGDAAIHAVEFNGLRSHAENTKVRRLARDSGRPLISGGDRHGTEPNALLNLTNASSFAEFCQEIRDGSSHLLALPHYREPLCLRVFHNIQAVLADMSDGTTWADRIWWERHSDEWEPLSRTWQHRMPMAVEWFVRSVRMTAHPFVRSATNTVSVMWAVGSSAGM
jgi:hypothetical protein